MNTAACWPLVQSRVELGTRCKVLVLPPLGCIMEGMAGEFERKHHALLARVIEHVLRAQEGPILVPDLADRAGFSRFHMGRLFHEVTQERLDGFVRRVRLERAAFRLKHSSLGVSEVAAEGGYESAEAFCRAFKAAFGVPPSRFRATEMPWKLPSPTNLHWNEHWGAADDSLPGTVCYRVEVRPKLAVALWRWEGNYSRLAEGWERLSELLAEPPRVAGFLTIYHDNMWTHPTTNTMRADLGWLLSGGQAVPKGMRVEELPAGMFAVSERLLKRTERNDAWSYAMARWPDGPISSDEYPAWPLPFEQVLTRIVVGPLSEIP